MCSVVLAEPYDLPFKIPDRISMPCMMSAIAAKGEIADSWKQKLQHVEKNNPEQLG